MSKNKTVTATKSEVPFPNMSGTFHGVFKRSHLLYEAFEIRVEGGVVVEMRPLSRAEDMAVNGVAIASSAISSALRHQTTKDLGV